MSRTSRHPVWCAKDHRCSVLEHRSAPHVFATDSTRFVVSMAGEPDRPQLEVIVRAAVPGLVDPIRSRRGARLLGAVVAAVLEELKK